MSYKNAPLSSVGPGDADGRGKQGGEILCFDPAKRGEGFLK